MMSGTLLTAPLQVEVVGGSWTPQAVAAIAISLLSLFITAGWSIYQFRLAGPRIKVTVKYRDNWSQLSLGGMPHLLIFVRNVGRQGTSLNGVYLRLKGQSHPIPLIGNPQRPLELKPAHAIYGEVAVEDVVSASRATNTMHRDITVSVATGLGLLDFPLQKVGKATIAEISEYRRSEGAG